MNGRFAVVTGASSGLGARLAFICAREGFDLLLPADRAEVRAVAERCRLAGASVAVLEVDLATALGVEQLCVAARGRPVDALLANAGPGCRDVLFEGDVTAVRRVVDTRITGTVDLVHRVAREMCRRGEGRILLTGSIARCMQGPTRALHNRSQAFLDSCSSALCEELADSGVTVTCLMTGPSGTDVPERAEMLDAGLARGRNTDPVDEARVGFDAMMRGEGRVTAL